MNQSIKAFLLFLLLQCLCYPSSAQYVGNTTEHGYLNFNYLNKELGLENISVTRIFEDREGFIWLAAETGIFRYDGQTMLYPSQGNDTPSHGLYHANTFQQDDFQRIWIGTETGLCLYMLQKEQIKDLKLPVKNQSGEYGVTALCHHQHRMWIGTPHGLFYTSPLAKDDSIALHAFPHRLLSSLSITQLLSSDDGSLWVGTRQQGIFRILPTAKEEKTPSVVPVATGEPPCEILSLAAYGKEQLLVGTPSGVIIVDSSPTARPLLKTTDLSSLCVSSQGEIWCTTYGNGIFYFKNLDIPPIHYTTDRYNKEIFNFINTAFIDSNDNLWIVPEKSGIRWLSNHARQITNFTHSLNSNSLPDNVIKGIAIGANGDWFLGTFHGLSVYSTGQQKFNNILLSHHNPLSNCIETVVFDRQGILWIGTRAGLFCYDSRKKQIKRIAALKDFFIWDIYPKRDRKGLWMATRSGVVSYSFDNQEYTVFQHQSHNPQSLSHNNVLTVYEDTRGFLWAGTEKGGVNMAFPQKTNGPLAFKHFYNETLSGGFSSNMAYTFHETQDGTIWMGTSTGLYAYDPQRQSFRHFTQNNGLGYNVIKGITEDQHHCLWLITHYGITSFNPDTQETKIFNTADGLAGNTFNMNACQFTKDGKLLAGGLNGLSLLNTHRLNQKKKEKPYIYLASLRVNDKEVRPGTTINGRVLIQNTLSATKEIRLSHKENNIAIELGCIELEHPEKIRWAYRLADMDEEWHMLPPSQNTVIFHHLEKGTHLLEYKSTDAHGQWNEECQQFYITVVPHWSQTRYAYTLYALMGIGLLIGGLQWKIKRIKRKEALENERKNHLQKMALEQEKLDFFTNISHELRTPVTLIAAPLDELLQKRKELSDKQQETYLHIIHRNARLLNKLIGQLLNFRKIQDGKAKLQLSEHRLPLLLSELVNDFSSYAAHLQISLQFHNLCDIDTFVCDREAVERIIANLLTNALKYTPQGGKVEVTLSLPPHSPGYCCIGVADNGIGIDAQQLEQIFERFQRLPRAEKKAAGIGIGLAFVKALVELHQGFIKVDSVPQQGSCFQVYLPTHLTATQTATSENLKEVSSIEQMTETTDEGEEQTKKENGKEKENLLIVEDNNDLLLFLKHFLGHNFNIITANNGTEGLAAAQKILPDIIITDVMMPQMDGLEMTRMLKNDIQTSHIPVIILTAKSDIENEMEGLETGADYFLKKPFHPHQLELIVENIHNNQKKMYRFLTHLLQRKADDNSQPEPVSPKNEWIGQVHAYITEHLNDPALNVETLAAQMNMSTMQLYRKLKPLTGTTPNEYIRNLRMQHAIELLHLGEMSVSEIAYTVGYSDPKYFSKCFKTLYGVSPSAYNKG